MRQTIFFATLIFICVLVLMPSQIKIGSTILYRPAANFSVLNLSIQRDLEFHLGLDLQGGTHLVYEADTSKVDSADRDSAIKATADNLERRINLLGVSESLVQTSQVGAVSRLIVELPGVKDINQAINTLGATAQLEFRETKSATPSAESDFIPTNLTGADLKIAQVQFGGSSSQISGQPAVAIQFTPDGAKKFSEITSRNIGRPLAIFLDNNLVSAPIVQQEISAGQAIISGSFTVDSAKNLAIQLNAGALPLPIKIVEQKNIGATLGQESILKSLIAGIIGLILIWLFMIANYGFKGLLANFALLIYILISLSLFKLVPVTLTLAGIAGFILSIGMAVDANILIFERMKEELRWGRPVHAAMELGFHRAWNSIRDSNVSSLLTASILFWFGSGPIRGFAVTLILGILVSLFTSITVTRRLLRLFFSH
ncbi:protein-export membrane protein SecD [Candidatus Amesbacteria bacterium RIFCSPHIGHO2_02_FULL_47_9]|uniref:Protein translocase subunit SecD n=1 Tax=Candidatus Amesbacteria bacterium RIFCSPHIGHO2_01_FULL_48_32b TaxID=1797253 RepID=A0A1F4YG38_9BACT|nr:MAG: protein-export membrane protein SecD [Candidatus Amesbacteria bacterium RIFCSPHIGHO2_01_FULL_48_32b]OGD04193.1 MAG: protein-export membrane protein SecD [Candidatus Amesbacteria bacterium RIFCSPHIGHO2_02_FULL_47_9]OGD07547.1 MAG: protein-export membrane protein SecD [Candidatus Amesbacteria bacterium RIFCSPLOWO2_01_FULL_49_25]